MEPPVQHLPENTYLINITSMKPRVSSKLSGYPRVRTVDLQGTTSEREEEILTSEDGVCTVTKVHQLDFVVSPLLGIYFKQCSCRQPSN